MNARRYLLIAIVVGSVMPRALAAPSPRRVLDQEQPNVDSGVTGFTHAIGGSSEQQIAQTVTVGRDGVLTEVRIPVACAKGILFVEIQGVSPTGLPDGVVHGVRKIPASLLPATFPATFQTFRFGSRLRYSAGDRFAIVLRMRTPPAESCGLFPGPTRDPYPAGETFYTDPTLGRWVPTGDTRDIPFETLVLEGP